MPTAYDNIVLIIIMFSYKVCPEFILCANICPTDINSARSQCDIFMLRGVTLHEGNVLVQPQVWRIPIPIPFAIPQTHHRITGLHIGALKRQYYYRAHSALPFNGMHKISRFTGINPSTHPLTYPTWGAIKGKVSLSLCCCCCGCKTQSNFGVIIKCWPRKVYTFPIKTSPPELLLLQHLPSPHRPHITIVVDTSNC